MATLYRYTTGGRDVEYLDEGDVYTPKAIQEHWAATFPELGAATWTETQDEATGQKIITFAKKVGTKGGNPWVLALLDTPAVGVKAVKLLDRLIECPLTLPAAYLAIADELDEAITQADGLAARSKEALVRCSQLPPVPFRQPPLGF